MAEQIRIRSVYLGAIEDENWPLIGAPVYTRGFLRTYARFLSLDPEEAVADFNDLTGPPAPTPDEVAIASRAGSKGLKPWIWGASVIAVALIAFVVYQEISLQERPDTQVALTSAAPSSSPTDAPSPTDLSPQPSGSPLLTTSPLPSGSPGASPVPGTLFTPGPNTISVQLSAPSWLRIVVDGNASIEGTFPAGTARTFRGKTAVVRVGNAGGVQILVDGKPIGPLGKAGDVVERTFTL